MQRGDAQLASVMRKLLAETDHSYVDFTWDSISKNYVLEFRGSAAVTEEEAQAIEEADPNA